MPGCQYYAYEGAAKGFLELNLPKDIKILDCGAGTGLLGSQLVERGGFTNVDALDGCEQMLEVAKKVFSQITSQLQNSINFVSFLEKHI